MRQRSQAASSRESARVGEPRAGRGAASAKTEPRESCRRTAQMLHAYRRAPRRPSTATALHEFRCFVARMLHEHCVLVAEHAALTQTARTAARPSHDLCTVFARYVQERKNRATGTAATPQQSTSPTSRRRPTRSARRPPRLRRGLLLCCCMFLAEMLHVCCLFSTTRFRADFPLHDSCRRAAQKQQSRCVIVACFEQRSICDFALHYSCVLVARLLQIRRINAARLLHARADGGRAKKRCWKKTTRLRLACEKHARFMQQLRRSSDCCMTAA